MLDYLNTEIEKRKIEIAKIEAERQRLDQRRHDLGIELRAYEDVLARLDPGVATATPSYGGKSATPVGTLTATQGVKRTKLADHWRVVLRSAVERYPAVVKNSEVGGLQRAAGYDPALSANIRTHFHKLRQEGLYEHAGHGAVRATKVAAEVLGIPLGTRSDPRQETEVPNGRTLFADKETAGHAHEANPAASVHH